MRSLLVVGIDLQAVRCKRLKTHAKQVQHCKALCAPQPAARRVPLPLPLPPLPLPLCYPPLPRDTSLFLTHLMMYDGSMYLMSASLK